MVFSNRGQVRVRGRGVLAHVAEHQLFEADAAAADAFAASLEAMAAFSDAARACFAFFLLARPGASSATGDAAGVGVSDGVGSIVGLGVGDAPPKTFENQLEPDVPAAHPARKISDSERTRKSCRIECRSIRLSRARDRWFGRRIGCKRNSYLTYGTFANF